jgi:hypothetical protein
VIARERTTRTLLAKAADSDSRKLTTHDQVRVMLGHGARGLEGVRDVPRCVRSSGGGYLVWREGAPTQGRILVSDGHGRFK